METRERRWASAGSLATMPAMARNTARKAAVRMGVRLHRDKREIRNRLLLRLRGYAQVRPGRLPALREQLLRVVVVDRAGNNYILALLPVGRRGDLVLRGELHRIEHPQHLVG